MTTIGIRVLRQCVKPSGWLGRLNLRSMNRRHSKLTDWGLQHVTIGSRDLVLDIGCGGGRTVAKLAASATGGRVTGIDYSEASVAVSRKTNADAANVEIVHGSVSALPFPDGYFDVAAAVETHYFWPDLASDLCEVRRVLKPGGTFAIIAEAYKGGKHDQILQRFERFAQVKLLTPHEHRELFVKAGFTDVQVHEEYDKGWLCVTGRR